MWRYIPTTRCALIEMSVITSQFKMLIALIRRLPDASSLHLDIHPSLRLLYISLSSAPPFHVAFSLSLPPSLHQPTLFISFLTPSPSVFIHTPSLSLGSRSCLSLPSSVSLHPFALSLTRPPSVFWTTKSSVLDRSINHQLHIESQ